MTPQDHTGAALHKTAGSKSAAHFFRNDIQYLHERLSRIHQSDFPYMIPIDNISFCNLRCSMCSHKGMLRKPGVMDIGLFKRIIDEVAAENKDTKLWMTFFGEAALLKDMPDRIAYAKKQGCTNTAINTNGSLLTKEIAEQYIKSGLDYLYVGIDAATPQTYAALRVGAGDISKTVGNVLAYRDLLARCGTGIQQVFVQFVIMDENEYEKEAFAQFWHERGITVKFRPKVSWINLVKEDVMQKVENADRFPCPWMIETFDIIHDGRVALCGVDVNCVYEVGNVRERSIKEVWNTAHRELRERFMRGANLPADCASCRDWLGKLSEYRKRTEG